MTSSDSSTENTKRTATPSVPHAQQKGRKRRPISEFDQDFVNPNHVADFVRALSQDPSSSGFDSGPEHITAASEIIPSAMTTRKKKKKGQIDVGNPKGFAYTLLRYPLIIGIGTIVAIELLLYISLRQVVRAWENFFSWRGTRRRLRSRLRAASSYEEWCRAAEALDTYMGKDKWKESPAYGYYDYRLIQKVIRHLRSYRQDAQHDEEAATNLKDVLYACLKSNFAGIENVKLYSNTYLGTKNLITEYVDEVTASIDALAKTPCISQEDKRLAFKLYSKNYGKSAFCLSGGAGFGYYHLGVVRALLDQKMLPPIITGTSAGALMGALVCTRTDDELRDLLVPELAHKINFVHDSILAHTMRYVTTGAFFDSEEWCRMACWFTRGSLTFREAYERTGRIFNVSVIPNDPHSPPKLLNYITAPNCIVWSAVLASAAIPGIQNPVVLLQKTPRSDRLIAYNYGHKFKDGSLRTDIPSYALHSHFGVNYTIVSQVNPHIHLFFYANQGSPGRPVTHRWGKGWRGGFLASAIEQFLKLDLSKWLKVVRDLDLMPKLLNQDWSSIWLQKFDGTVTILPKTGILDWLYIVSNPTERRVRESIRVGEERTWPKISMISNRLRIESSIRLGRAAVSSKRSVKTNGNPTGGCASADKRLSMTVTSDDASGSGDEIRFLAGRRASMPDGSGVFQEREWEKEERRRRKFMAQFTDRRQVLDGKEIVAEAQQDEAASDSDDEDEGF
ncbi:acyl transferase/acyl hydrolase/lysophospholipase [Syncephalastrum racemosum]|uniref:Patatin-like phospholipase domain-containing protein n=1 Tax=Syncephalastrum racemosum TaxID=13706 RepID=A0A1X2HC64_SYNRA|nr:acyl transferase/acyl hydrolase/lysophospholipase [Syncephalastrum racemosum]